jgi:5'(3')-deoxyribonucleotidase
MNIYKNRLPLTSLGFDIDCVVADTMEAFIRIAREEYTIDIKPEQITHFNVEQCLNMDDAIVQNIFHKLMVDPIGYKLKLLPDARPVLQKIQTQAPLTFITARPLRDPIVDWLEHELGSQITADMHIIAMGDHDSKTEHILDLGLTHFIDDRFETCETLAQEGIIAMVFDQPWNSGRHSLPVVRSWQDIHACCFPLE